MPFIKQLDSLKARFVKISDVSTSKYISAKDTLDFAKYKMDYYDKERKYIGYLNKEVQYVLKEAPAKKRNLKVNLNFIS